MSVLVYRTTELRDLAVRRCWFDIIAGWRDGVSVRGEDATVAQAAGRDELPRLDDVRTIELHGYVLGTSEANWNTVMSTLETTFDPAAVAANLVVHTPYLGLAAGTRTISARVESVRTTDIVPQLVTEFQVVLQALGVDWT